MQGALAVVLLLGLAASVSAQCGTGTGTIPANWRIRFKRDDAGSTQHTDLLTTTEYKWYSDTSIEFKTSWSVNENHNLVITWDPPLPGGSDQWVFRAKQGTYAGSGLVSDVTSYTVTVKSKACTAGVTRTFKFGFATRLPDPFSWSYSDPEPKYIACKQIQLNNPPVSWSGEDVKYKIEPELPAGLLFDEDYGYISGISYVITDDNNDDVADKRKYTVTATNLWGEQTKSDIDLIVNPTKPRALWYWLHKTIDVTRGRYMVHFYPKWKCSRPTQWSISPELPEGITLNPHRGYLSGQPKVITHRIKYVITGSNHLGSANTTVRIRVWEAPKYLLKRLGWQPCQSYEQC